MKTLLIQGAMVWVCGDLKWMLRTTTVTQILKVSRIMVNRTNLPSRGTTKEVGGMISASRRKNTVRERRMLMERLTCKVYTLTPSQEEKMTSLYFCIL